MSKEKKQSGDVHLLETTPSSEKLLAESTRLKYSRDLTYFATWYRLTYGEKVSYPVSEASIYDFIVQHGLDGLPGEIDEQLVAMKVKRHPGLLRHRTILRKLSAIAVKHNDEGDPSPTSTSRICRACGWCPAAAPRCRAR